MTTTRFAPSPTGYLHLGHAYSALFAFEKASPEKFLLRIEDIDPVRCKLAFTDAIFEDLAFLGLIWHQPVRHQSQHIKDYGHALDKLRAKGLLYPCFCTRREVEDNAHSAAQAPHSDDTPFIYSGTCRHLSPQQRTEKFAQHKTANWRLDVASAVRETGELFWHDRAKGKMLAQPEMFGDVILARKDIGTSYHLSVTVDDHLQKVDLVTRGEDLLTSTHIHRLLQALLGYSVPEYEHHSLLTDPTGKRFAKRDRSVTLQALRLAGKTPEAILAMLPLRN